MFEQLAPARFAHQASYSAKMSPQEIAQLKRQTQINLFSEIMARTDYKGEDVQFDVRTNDMRVIHDRRIFEVVVIARNLPRANAIAADVQPFAPPPVAPPIRKRSTLERFAAWMADAAADGVPYDGPRG